MSVIAGAKTKRTTLPKALNEDLKAYIGKGDIMDKFIVDSLAKRHCVTKEQVKRKFYYLKKKRMMLQTKIAPTLPSTVTVESDENDGDSESSADEQYCVDDETTSYSCDSPWCDHESLEYTSGEDESDLKSFVNRSIENHLCTCFKIDFKGDVVIIYIKGPESTQTLVCKVVNKYRKLECFDVKK